MEPSEEHNEMLRLLRENNELSKANNELLKKLYRHNLIGFVTRVVWYAVLLGLPVAVYFYILGPYFNAFGSNYELFRQGMAEVPGLKAILHILP